VVILEEKDSTYVRKGVDSSSTGMVARYYRLAVVISPIAVPEEPASRIVRYL
jgi:hypothetical protein